MQLAASAVHAIPVPRRNVCFESPYEGDENSLKSRRDSDSYVRPYLKAAPNRSEPLSSYFLWWGRPVSYSVLTVRWIGTLSKWWGACCELTRSSVRLISKRSKLGFFLFPLTLLYAIPLLFTHPTGVEWSTGFLGRLPAGSGMHSLGGCCSMFRLFCFIATKTSQKG